MSERGDRQKCRPILQREWDHQKSKILSRRSAGMTSRDLVTLLCEEGFQVTFSQLQTQLRRWKSRQNLDRNGWVRVLGHMDGLVSSGKEVRIKLSGEVVDPRTIKNARRYLRHTEPSRIHLTPDTCPESVAIEARESGENWRVNVQHTADVPIDDDASELDDDTGADAFDNSTTDPPVEVAMETQADLASALPTLDNDFLDNDFEAFPVFGQDWVDGYETTSAVSFADQHGLSPLVPYMSPNDTTPMIPMSQLLSESVRSLRPSSPHHAGGTQISVLPLDTPFILSCFNSLPSVELHRDLTSAGIQLLSLRHEADARDAVTHPEPPLRRETLIRLSEILVPGFRPNFQQVPTSASDLLSSSNVLESQRTNILIAAILNGPSSLSGVDMPHILGTMHRQADLPHMVSQLLRRSPRFAARAIAENLLKAAIESQDIPMAIMLLATDLVDVNALVCLVDGTSFTALERAAVSENLSMVRLLLQKGAGQKPWLAPGVALTRQPTFIGPIGELLRRWPGDATITRKMIVLIETLLVGGAEINVVMFDAVLRKFQSDILRDTILSHMPPRAHDLQRFALAKTLPRLVEIEDEEFSIKAVRQLFIDSCECSSCIGCLRNLSPEVITRHATDAMSRRKLRLCKLLLPYAKQWARIERHEVTFSFGDQDFSLVSERFLSHYGFGSEIQFANHLTLNEASIQADDWSFVQALVNNENHPHGFRLSLVWEGLRHAARADNLDSVRELLGSDLIDFPDMHALPLLVLNDAISQGKCNVAWELVNAGTRFDLDNQTLRCGDLLIQAIQQKRRDLATAILDGFHFWENGADFARSLFREAVRGGDKTLIVECCRSCPIHDQDLDLDGISDSIDVDMLQFLIESGFVPIAHLAPVLEAGLTNNNSDLVRVVCEYTTHITSECLDIAVAHDRVDLLEDFFQRCGYTRLSAPPGFGLRAIELALEQGDSGSKAFELLVDAECINVRRCCLQCKVADGKSCVTSPLALAILHVSERASSDVCLPNCPVRRLLNAGCSPNDYTLSRDSRGLHRIHRSAKKRLNIGLEDRTAMLQAIATGNTALVELFLEHGALVNKPVALGLTRTPLQRAVEVNSMDIVRTLLQHGADVNAPPASRQGFTCVQLAAMNGNCNMLAELLIHGAHLYTPPNVRTGRWPLEGAAEHNQLNMVSFLWQLSRGGFEEAICARAKELARSNGHLGCVELIEELESSRWQPPVPSFVHGAELNYDDQQWMQGLAESFLISPRDDFDGGVPGSS